MSNENRFTEVAIELREMYDAHISAGFTEEQTIKLMESMTYGLFAYIQQYNAIYKRPRRPNYDALKERITQLKGEEQ